MKFHNFVFSITLLLAANCAAGQVLAFYGGDVNPDDPNVYSFPNGNTLAQPDTHTYGCITLPYGHTPPFRASAIMFNMVASVQDDPVNLFDPMVATFEIHRSIEEGEGGIVVSTGNQPITVTPTGRVVNGMTEYTVFMGFGGSKRVTFGGAYCVNITPQCTNPDNPNCSTVEFFVDNTTQRTNAVHPHVELDQELWVYSPPLGYNYANWCDVLNQEQCSWMSFGVYQPH